MIVWKDKAIILSKINYSETSLILKAFTLNKGIQTGLVRGGKKIQKSNIFESGNLVKLDILVNGEIVDSFSSILAKENAEFVGRNRVKKLSDLIPRQQFDIPIQAAIGSRIIARETIKALRKDVTAKLYGGDVTRKRKLLEKQKEGKKKMRQIGKVSVPKEAFREFLKQ